MVPHPNANSGHMRRGPRGGEGWGGGKRVGEGGGRS
jgi:hypothetical protein